MFPPKNKPDSREKEKKIFHCFQAEWEENPLYEDVAGDSFDTGLIYEELPPPPELPELKAYRVKEVHQSRDYHQTFLLSRKRTSCCEYFVNPYLDN